MAGTCVITGGAGFIGTRLSRSLTDRFDEVVIVDAFVDQVHGSSAGLARENHGTVYHSRLEDPDQYGWLERHKPDVLIHLAAETGTAQSMTDSALHVRSNVLGTAVLLDSLLEHDAVPKQIVLASSRAVYGEGGYADSEGRLVYPGIRSREKLESSEWGFPGLSGVRMSADVIETKPASVYGATKLTQEHLLTAWSQAYGPTLSILRLQNVYGAGQAPSNPYTGILPLFFKIAVAGAPIPLYEDGLIERDFVHVTDVVRAIVSVLDEQAAGTWDVGTGQRTTIADIAEVIAELVGGPPPEITGQYRLGDVRAAVADVTRLSQEFGWSPRVSLRQGLEELRDWLAAGAPLIESEELT
jgi:dTDP-L-rhamnose 4-epimerase